MIRYNTKRYWGNSTDIKPINAQIGDRFLEIDTQLEYFFSEYNEWKLIGFDGDNYLSLSGGTVTGPTIFTNGLTANTISATTYLNLPEASPTHVKIGSMSGRFTSASPNSPDIKYLFVGNSDFGWSFGDYNLIPSFDGFGNLTNIKQESSFVGIPLPTDILVGDKIKICGLCYYYPTVETPLPLNETFYVTVSYFTCENYLIAGEIDFNTLIPVASYLFGENRSICFSEEVTNYVTLPGCTTYLVVGMTVGNDNEDDYNYRFSYTIDTTQLQTTPVGPNYFIRNCCDPAHSEVIQNNGVPIGSSFVDVDGNCWSIIAETTSDITNIRPLDNVYDNCDLCMDDNECPQNFVVQSCCYVGSETFTASLQDVEVGSTFVDEWGFCWSVTDITPLPITNVVTVGTVYPSTNCDSAECTDVNTCPNILLIVSCCRDMGQGFTTSDILGISVAEGDTFVDTFGICWLVKSENNAAFPTLNFLSGSTIYGIDDCETCVASNNCNITLFYTVQNCCTEEIEVIQLPASYGIGITLGLVHDNGMGCYKILSWSDVGTPTLTGVIVQAVSEGSDGCTKCIESFLRTTCIGQTQCCTSYLALKSGGTITGYLCDGTWVVDQLVPEGSSLCMAQTFKVDGVFTQGCCSFSVYNPSPTIDLVIDVIDCKRRKTRLTLNPLETSDCFQCVERASGPWEWVDCA